MKNELVVQRKEGHNLKDQDQKLKRKLTFDIPKFKSQNGLEQKTSKFWAFLRQTGLWEPNPSKNVQVFFADSESCERCGDFSTRVGRWST